MEVLNITRKQLNSIQQTIQQSREETRQEVAAIKENRDLTDQAKNKKIENLQRERDKVYADQMQKRAKVITETSDKLANRLYSGNSDNPIQFDMTVSELTKRDDEDLIGLLNQKPSSETRRAVLKAATIGERPRAKVLEAASKDPAITDEVAEYVTFQKEYGIWEPKSQRLERKLMGG